MELKQMLKESLLELSKYIERAKPEVEQMNNYIYVGVEEKAIEKIPVLIEGLKWISDVLGHAIHFNSNVFPAEMFLLSLNDDLKEMEEAMENQDWITFADILQYQLIPLLSQIGETSKRVGGALQ